MSGSSWSHHLFSLYSHSSLDYTRSDFPLLLLGMKPSKHAIHFRDLWGFWTDHMGNSFGKFGSHYIKREFYFDVHPPLGKMLVGLSGYLAGYNGSFEFKSGDQYPEDVNYTFMRAFNAFFGAVTIPLAYYTARELNLKRPAVWFVTLMVLCENSYTTISRFILLDSMLLCFTFTTVLCWARFHNLQKQSWSAEWFIWLMLTGVSIGCVCSVKMVGLFCTAMVGIYTIEDLWNKFGNTKMPKVTHIYMRGY